MGAKIATLFSPDKDSLLEGTPGRSERLIDLRNKALCARYYYYMAFRHYNYLKACEELSLEFFISIIQIQKVLKANTDLLKQYRTDAPSLKELGVQYPLYNWQIKY